MAWFSLFGWKGPNTRTAWGYTFEWTEDHLALGQTEPLKQSYDVLAEQCLDILNRLHPPADPALPRNSSNEMKPTMAGNPEPKPSQRDLYALLRDNASSDATLNRLWTDLNTIPSWVDWDQIARGQDVFYRYGGAALTGLAYQSLLGGMGGARVVETLARTGGFSTKVARRRLFETTQHILQCTRTLEGLQPGGEGFASSVRVRFLHAAVRKRILTLAAQRPEYYDVAKFGVPINDLDSIATICTFSGTLIWISFPRQGIWITQQEKKDYVALWRYIAHLMGCPTDYFATPELAKAVMETLLLTEIDPSEMSKLLANNIIKSLEDIPPGHPSNGMLVASARWLNGNELGDRLGLPRVGIYYWMLMAGQCMFFSFFALAHHVSPSWDRKKVAFVKKLFYRLIVESKDGLAGMETLFDFKYVPEYSTITDMHEENKGQKPRRTTDMRNLQSFLFGVGILGVVGWCTFKATAKVLSFVPLLWR